ncbi:MAG TPA: hypothetical protein DGG95_06450 [Cytophagales bacterium]|jgi:hypothetical protein|nr:hypothetical protein [Cytophagales bacterium]
MKQKSYAVVPIESPVILRSRSGEVYTYSSYRKFLSLINYNICNRIGVVFRVDKYDFEERKYIYTADFVAMQKGIVLDPTKIREDLKEFNYATGRQKHKAWWYRSNKIYTYRGGPVPYIGKRSGGGYYRHMKTTQERRWSFAAKVDGVPWRARRNARNLPNPWDDICRTVTKSWKKHRKTQWK